MSSSLTYQSPNPNPNPNPNQPFDEQRWIVQIRRAIEEEDDDLEHENGIPASIFNVPKSLMLTSPESYVPQLVALGPYHHSRPELHEMERHKLSAAKRSQKRLQGLKFENLVDELHRAELRFRACYHKFLNLQGETLAWMMAVDSCFILEFLRGESGSRKPGHRDAVLRDIVMLENQVPLFSLKKTLEFFSGSDRVEDQLYRVAVEFCKEISPFSVFQESGDVDRVKKSAHLLEFLYNLTIPGFLEDSGTTVDDDEPGLEKKNNSQKTGPLNLMKRLFSSKPVSFFLSLPWKIFSNLPGVMVLRQVDYFCFPREKDENTPAGDVNRHPSMEEIAIPSVSELFDAGVKFAATGSGIPGVNFEVKTATFYLPTVSIDVNSEVVLRNLVAYEAACASRPLICARYAELMNGIVDGEGDAKILRECGIVLNHLKSDGDVADLWNGMSKSIRLTKVPFLDRVIEDVNGHYNGRWRVRIGKMVGIYVFGSWRSMTFLAAVLLLFFMTLQAFCSIFGCARG